MAHELTKISFRPPEPKDFVIRDFVASFLIGFAIQKTLSLTVASLSRPFDLWEFRDRNVFVPRFGGWADVYL